MSDSASETPNEIKPAKRPTGIDPFLQSLVHHADYDGFEFGITLSVGGILVSGMLVSGRKFFENFGEKFGSAFEDAEVRKSLASSFSEWGVLYDPQEDGTRRESTYLHIKDVAFFTTNSQPIPSDAGSWWRGRISEVDGFLLGNLTAK